MPKTRSSSNRKTHSGNRNLQTGVLESDSATAHGRTQNKDDEKKSDLSLTSLANSVKDLVKRAFTTERVEGSGLENSSKEKNSNSNVPSTLSSSSSTSHPKQDTRKSSRSIKSEHKKRAQPKTKSNSSGATKKTSDQTRTSTTCDLCFKIFRNYQNLREHVVFHHTEDGKLLYQKKMEKKKLYSKNRKRPYLQKMILENRKRRESLGLAFRRSKYLQEYSDDEDEDTMKTNPKMKDQSRRSGTSTAATAKNVFLSPSENSDACSTTSHTVVTLETDNGRVFETIKHEINSNIDDGME